jgi:hypothetical protein
MFRKRWSLCGQILTVTALACLIGASARAVAQNNDKPVHEKWRPKDGLYVVAVKDFNERCEDSVDLVGIHLRNKKITSDESSDCKITKTSDTGPGRLRLSLACGDSEEGESTEVMTLRKIDESSLFLHMTVKGKFRAPEQRAVYCPETVQRAYIESKAREKEAIAREEAETRRRAAEERARLAASRPRDGVYASPGADFNERCTKSGDAVIALATNSVTSGSSSCHVSYVTDKPPNTTRLDVICDRQPGTPGLIMRNGSFQPPGAEIITMVKIDDRTVNLQKTRNGEFSEPARELAYCPDAAQRSYVDSTKTKQMK